MRRRTGVALGLLVAVAGLGALALWSTLRSGLSAREEPPAIEVLLARVMRRYAVPADLKDRKNPVRLTPEVLAEAKAHFADHCASCHGNDGKGQTAMGPNFYPKVPDMTLAETQSQSDGALFATIENGIRLTGMPAWGNGTAESAYGSWTLVHFIRHLPRLTPEEIEDMRGMNPKSREEWEAESEERRFLEGSDDTPAPAARGHH